MTIKQRVHDLVTGKWPEGFGDEVPATLEKMVILAYYIGREDGVRQVAEKYNKHIEAQHERAQECRYHAMAEKVVGPETYLYSSDYAGDMTGTFGSDPADI